MLVATSICMSKILFLSTASPARTSQCLILPCTFMASVCPAPAQYLAYPAPACTLLTLHLPVPSCLPCTCLYPAHQALTSEDTGLCWTTRGRQSTSEPARTWGEHANHKLQKKKLVFLHNIVKNDAQFEYRTHISNGEFIAVNMQCILRND